MQEQEYEPVEGLFLLPARFFAFRLRILSKNVTKSTPLVLFRLGKNRTNDGWIILLYVYRFKNIGITCHRNRLNGIMKGPCRPQRLKPKSMTQCCRASPGGEGQQPGTVESADVAEDKRSVRIRSRNQLRTLEYTKKDGRLPPGGQRKPEETAFRQGVNGDYLLWVEDGRFCMYDRGCIDNEEEERTK